MTENKPKVVFVHGHRYRVEFLFEDDTVEVMNVVADCEYDGGGLGLAPDDDPTFWERHEDQGFEFGTIAEL